MVEPTLTITLTDPRLALLGSLEAYKEAFEAGLIDPAADIACGRMKVVAIASPNVPAKMPGRENVILLRPGDRQPPA